MAVMPMFPLGSVLLPGTVLPLHVFEPRYLAMMRDCAEQYEYEFGVALIERGSEVGGGDQRTGIGTVARMVQLGELGDGRLLVVCIGTRRIRVNAWLPDDPYPLADVDEWPDSWDVDAAQMPSGNDFAERITRVASRVRRAAALAVELGDHAGDASSEMSDDALLASYQLAALLPVGAADTYRLLAAPGPAERVTMIEEMLDDVEALLQFRLSDDDQPEV
ncbi:MAG: LON peptidase substrate-binding domain-containing protein [Actinomycetota bacterium]|jgi:Lon protease-like protein